MKIRKKENKNEKKSQENKTENKKINKKQNKKKFKFSWRMKLTLTLLILTTGMFLSYLLFNRFFFSDYYWSIKEKNLFKVYQQIDKIVGNKSELSDNDSDRIMKLCERNGISIVIVDNKDESLFQYGNAPMLIQRLQQINLEITPKEEYKLIKSGDGYQIHSVDLSKIHMSGYLEVNGFFNSNMNFLMRMSVESIDESVTISTEFFAKIGLCIMLISMVVAYFISERFTKPVLELAHISREMANLNFNIKYKSKSEDEIDELGCCMNEMSDKLEKTIIELKQANAELKSDIKKKEEIDEMRKDFIANVSHELKTPIALIQGYAEGLTECVNDDDDSREFYCSVISDEAEKMNKMVRNLLSLTQMEFGNLELQYEKFDLHLMVDGVIDAVGYLIEQNDVKVVKEYSGESFIYADEFKSEEVVNNFLTNAINHCKYNKEIIISEEKIDKKFLRFKVFNTGDPIPEEDLEKIWIKFYKVDKARTREYGGSGIGLSIVKAIASAHNTNCGVRNCENGVEFWYDFEM